MSTTLSLNLPLRLTLLLSGSTGLCVFVKALLDVANAASPTALPATRILRRVIGSLDPLLFGDIRDLLDQQFNRWSALEKEIMYWLAIDREPVSIARLGDDIVPNVTSASLLEALSSLGRSFLIEPTNGGFTLQPVIMEYITEQFVERVASKIMTREIKLFRSHELMKAQEKDYVKYSQICLLVNPYN